MLRQCCGHGFTGFTETWMKRRHHCWRVLPVHFDGLNVGSDSHLHLLSEWVPQLVASFHLSLARICCIIGGITTDAMSNTRKVAHLCGAVVFGPSKNSSRFVALTVEKDICRILLAPYHPWIEPFRSSENDISVKWLAHAFPTCEYCSGSGPKE